MPEEEREDCPTKSANRKELFFTSIYLYNMIDLLISIFVCFWWLFYYLWNEFWWLCEFCFTNRSLSATCFKSVSFTFSFAILENIRPAYLSGSEPKDNFNLFADEMQTGEWFFDFKRRKHKKTSDHRSSQTHLIMYLVPRVVYYERNWGSE